MSQPKIRHRFIRYRTPGSVAVIGLVGEDEKTVVAILNPATGKPYSSLFEFIEDHPRVDANDHFQYVSGSEQNLSEVEKLAPLPGRDIICIGKNYIDHAKEFNQSGFDASDKKDLPEYPVFFTKRASSIVPDGHPIYLHPGVTSSVDYEGELGIVIGMGGIGIKKQSAWEHVWGAVILNDVTARERQRDHKQFFIGKSLDTFCPMGAYVVPSSSLSYTNLHLTTKVNGEIRQSQNTSELIFDVPTLIETASMGITLQPGDIIATGTPYGTGMAKMPGTWLKEGDVVEISIPPLGTLRSTVSSPKAPPFHSVAEESHQSGGVFPDIDKHRLLVGNPPKALHVEVSGPEDGQAVLFFHGLGGTLHIYKPAIETAGLEKRRRIILFDIEGHGQSPLSPGSHKGMSITQMADDAKAILDSLNIEKSHIVGHSMGGLIAATFAAKYPKMVKNLVLLGPALHYSATKRQGLRERAEKARSLGMTAVADQLSSFSLSERTRTSNPLAKAFVHQAMSNTPLRGYALACLAIAESPDLDLTTILAEKIVVVAGTEDAVITKDIIDFIEASIKGVQIIRMESIGHNHAIEDIPRTAEIFSEFFVVGIPKRRRTPEHLPVQAGLPGVKELVKESLFECFKADRASSLFGLPFGVDREKTFV